MSDIVEPRLSLAAQQAIEARRERVVRRHAVLAVCFLADDATDAAELLASVGLDPTEGRVRPDDPTYDFEYDQELRARRRPEETENT